MSAHYVHSPYVSGLSNAQWHKLPLKLRQRWWRETEYGRRAPGEALVAAIREAVAKQVAE